MTTLPESLITGTIMSLTMVRDAAIEGRRIENVTPTLNSLMQLAHARAMHTLECTHLALRGDYSVFGSVDVPIDIHKKVVSDLSRAIKVYGQIRDCAPNYPRTRERLFYHVAWLLDQPIMSLEIIMEHHRGEWNETSAIA